MMIAYLIEVSMFWFLFLGIYFLFFRNEQLHHYNRIYLLITLLGALVIPLVQIGVPQSLSNAIELPEILMENSVAGTTVDPSRDFGSYFIWGIYCFGVTCMSIRFGSALLKVYRTRKSGIVSKIDGVSLIYSDGVKQPFSFGKMIFFNSAFAEEEEDRDAILQHELVHVKQRHSIDMILIEIIKAAFWFNPLIYILGREIKLVHEYAADSSALSNPSSSKKRYKKLLLSIATGTDSEHLLLNTFYSSFISKRILMINSKKTSPSKIKWFTPIPLFLLFFFVGPATSQISFGQTTDDLDNKGKVALKEVDKHPLMKGCENEEQAKDCSDMKLIQYIYTNIEYPEKAREKGTEGTVVVKFVISKTGKPGSFEVVRDPGHGLGDEALRVIKTIPDFIPAEVDNKQVAVEYFLPVRYKLEDDEKENE